MKLPPVPVWSEQGDDSEVLGRRGGFAPPAMALRARYPFRAFDRAFHFTNVAAPHLPLLKIDTHRSGHGHVRLVPGRAGTSHLDQIIGKVAISVVPARGPCHFKAARQALWFCRPCTWRSGGASRRAACSSIRLSECSSPVSTGRPSSGFTPWSNQAKSLVEIKPCFLINAAINAEFATFAN